MTTNPNIKIIVATHKQYRMPEDSIYLPLQVGAEGKTDSEGKPLDFGYQKDNTGDNISELNWCFGTQTALYWAWKNLSADYTGLVHYRRYFLSRKPGKNEDMYVLIIANENYGSSTTSVLIPDVPYALNDGELMREYLVKALGVPERQVKVLKNATMQDIEQEGIHWLAELSQAVAGKKGDEIIPTANILIYFAGHGFVDLDGVAYLMPTGINTANIESLQAGKKGNQGFDIVLSKKESKRLAEQCLSIEGLCSRFNAKVLPVKNLTLVVDASFNGMGRDGKPLVRSERKDEGKKRRKPTLRSDVVAMLAADYTKTAFAFDEHQHGFLTYFLLKEVKLQGDNIFRLTYQDLFEEVARKLGKESALQNRWQEAIGIAGGKYKEGWQKMKIYNKITK